MREEIAEKVHPVLSYGLLLHDRLKRGEQLDFDTEQAVLKGRLGTDLLQVRHLPDLGGDPPGVNNPLGVEPFLGIRYALVCWLDEIFILDSPWGTRWNEKKLEAALYGTQDRAFRFWEQARLAEIRTTPDALEGYYLCVMLGFRGELAGRPDRLRGWVQPTQVRLGKTLAKELMTLPPELEFRPNVPPRYGRHRLQTMIMFWGAFILLLVPALVFYVAFVLLKTN